MSLTKCVSEKMFVNEHLGKSEESFCIVKDNIVIGRTFKEDEGSSVEQAIIHHFDENPDFIGVINAETDEKVTFGQMKDRSIRCALWLRKQGIKENDFVAISTPNQISDYVPFLATLYVNAIVNPWHYNSTEENLQHCFATCPPKVMFACEQSIDKLNMIAKEKGIDCKFVAFKKHPVHISLEEILDEQTPEEVNNFHCTIPSNPKNKLSLIVWSSGTTSAPKAIMLSYHFLVTRQLRGSGIEKNMICLWYTSFAWVLYYVFTSEVIRLHCTRIIHEKFDPEMSASIVEKYKINFVFVRPYLLGQWYQAKVWTRYNFSQLSTITVGGTRATKNLLMNCQMDLPKTFIRHRYGITEAGGSIAWKVSSCKHIDSVGFVRCGVQLKIVDLNSGALLGPNQQGEINVRANTNMLGYYQNDEETRKIMDKDGWIRTGDLGYYDEDGEIIIVDRLKSMIKMRSFSLLPSEVEDVLMQHPAVKNCAIVPVEHPIDIERPFIFIVKVHGSQVTAEELIDLAANKNELYRLSSGLFFVDELPRTPNGKIWLIKLIEMAREYLR